MSMTYRKGALRCDRLLCRAEVAHWVRQLAAEDARAAGWHAAPCACEWRDTEHEQDWKHQRDYCSAHFPQPPRTVQTVRSPLL